MIGKDKELDKFYDNLCDLLSQKKAWPDGGIIGIVEGGGVCRACGSEHEWSVFHEIVTTFWEQGGDVNDNWKHVAKVHGFDADALHELMLGVFIGGDRAPSRVIYDPETPYFGETP